MFNRYLLNLYKQYCDARGVVCNPFDGKNLSYDFLEWITINKLMAKEYSDYLLYLGHLESKTVAEVGKGRYDSIASKEMAVISPYADTLELPKSELFVIDGVPLIEQGGKIVLPEQQILLTHNPYDEMRIINWSRVHNTGDYDISIGMFGSIYDEDFSKKVKLIEEISKRMTEDHVIDYDTDKDKYFCSLNSMRKVKVKTLTR